MTNPLLTCPGIQERGRNLIHLSLRSNPQVTDYRFLCARTVNDAYGDPLYSGVGGLGAAMMFQVPRGGAFRSASLRRSGRGQIIGSIKGTTHAAFSPDDFQAPPGLVVPSDDQWLFVRVQENRVGVGFLAYAGSPTATVTLVGTLAADQVVVKGVFFEFAAGANNLAGKAGTALDPFLVGLGASDAAAAANLMAALNDVGDVIPVFEALAPVNTHVRATNPGAPSPDVSLTVEDAAANLLFGAAYAYTITTSDAGRLVLSPAVLAAGALVWGPDPSFPVSGPIYGVPPATHFGTLNPSFTVFGTAPSGSGSVAGSPPDLSDDISNATPRAMHLVFPGWLLEVNVRNLSGVALLVALGPDQPMQTVPASSMVSLTSGSARAREVIVACPVGVAGADFSLHAVAATGA